MTKLAHRIEVWPVDRLKPYERNARTHSPAQVAKIAASLAEFGFVNPVLVDSSDGIIAGHGRMMAARSLGLTDVPVIVLDHLTDAQRRAYILADNKLAELAGWDVEILRDEIAWLDNDGADLLAAGFSDDELTEFLGDGILPDGMQENTEKTMQQVQAEQEVARGTLAEQFGAPPFSVLDTRQGYWQTRRDAWLKLTGDLTETKGNVLAGGAENMISEINAGSSNFDPVLAELMMRWFAPAGGKVLDPFGGEQTKGVVAGTLGLHYSACEFRADQVAVNRRACAKYKGVHYVCGDSEQIATAISERNFDLCFTSPPYYDLEIYSKDDMSAFGTYEEFMAKYERIFASCVEMLRQDSFLVIKIGEIRNKKTGIYRNFVGDNISMFTRLGLQYYNEIALLNSFGTAPQRAGRYMNTRKLVKVHQNVLVFVKGDPTLAAAKCGPVQAVQVAEQ